MACLKFTRAAHWAAIEAHLAGGRGERFAFAHIRQLAAAGPGPVVEVVGVDLIDEHDVVSDGSGWYLTDAALDRVHNAAVTGGHGLVEFHNHHLGPPRSPLPTRTVLPRWPTTSPGCCPTAPTAPASTPRGAFTSSTG